jgi:hypothetical protein
MYLSTLGETAEEKLQREAYEKGVMPEVVVTPYNTGKNAWAGYDGSRIELNRVAGAVLASLGVLGTIWGTTMFMKKKKTTGFGVIATSTFAGMVGYRLWTGKKLLGVW